MEPNEEELIAPEPLEVGDQGLGDDDLGEGVSEEAFGLYGNKDLKYGTEVNQCCSGALWVPIEVLEDGYGHRIGL